MPDRAARAWTERMAVSRLGGIRYTVDSQSGATCKHRRRVAIELTSRRATAASTAWPVGPRRSFPRRATCRVEPGDVVVTRETGDRLVVAAADRRADEVTIAAADTTVADYPTNEGYPPDDVVVEVSYLGDAVGERPHRTYSFPLSRLRRTDGAALFDA